MSSGFNVTNAGVGPEAPSASAASSASSSAAPESFGTTSTGTATFDQIFHGGGLLIVPPAVEAYVKDVDAFVKSAFPNVIADYVEGLPSIRYYVVKRPDGAAIGVINFFTSVQSKDERDIQWRRRDLHQGFAWLNQKYPGIVLAHLTTLLTNYQGDMERTRQDAEDIIRTLRFKVDPSMMGNASVFTGKTMSTNYDVEEVRSVATQTSPHGVIPRIETGAVYQTVVNNSRDTQRGSHWSPNAFMGDQPQRPTNVVAIGGYVEIGAPIKRQVAQGVIEERFEVFYHITHISSQFAVLGMAAMALSAFSAHIVNDLGWVGQFYNKKVNGDLAMVVEDADNPGHFLETANNDQVRAFAERQFWKPVIILDIMQGQDVFPGLNNLTTEKPERQRNVANYLGRFFNRTDTYNMAPTRYVGLTLEGFYGDASGTLRDTRHYDWFKLAMRDGVDAQSSVTGRIWRMITRDDLWVMDRFRSLRERLADVIPMAERQMYVINPNWLNWVAKAMKDADIKIQDTSVNGGYASNVGSIGADFIVDRLDDPTTTLFGSNDLDGSDIFDV